MVFEIIYLPGTNVLLVSSTTTICSRRKMNYILEDLRVVYTYPKPSEITIFDLATDIVQTTRSLRA